MELILPAATKSEASGRTSDRASLAGVMAYAAPVPGSWFYYIAMWSVMPGVYAKYAGVPLASVAMCLMFIRLFDGVTDTTIGFLADWHRSAGGTRKPWTVAGGVVAIVACCFLFNPGKSATAAYYLAWSFIYFVGFTTSEIPHLAWGSELTLDYQGRARVYGVRNVMTRIGTLAFYGLPLLPIYATSDYTLVVMRDAVYVGAGLTIIGVVIATVWAPVGAANAQLRQDSPALLLRSLFDNRPLMLYLAAFAGAGLYCGMWYGMLYLYLDGYLRLGSRVPLIFLVATFLGMLSTPLWLAMIRRLGKPRTWAFCAALFFVQLVGTLFVGPGDSWWLMLALVTIANLSFNCNDIAALSLLGDIVDYGKLKFRKDRGATYFAVNILIFKVGLGIGSGVALGTAAFFGFSPAKSVNSAVALLGVKVAFVILPACFALLTLFLITRSPIDRRRHEIIRKRLESRLRSRCGTGERAVPT